MSGLPIGSIIVFRGSTVPDGWAVCNGSNGTPNLVDRFVYGASIDSDLRTTGGATTHTHTNPNTSWRSAHGHTGGTVTSTNSGSANQQWGALTNAVSSHTHSVTFSVTTANTHSHTVGDTGSATNLPPYLKRVFIMKTA